MELFLEEKKRLEREADHSFYLVPRLGISADIIPLFSWRALHVFEHCALFSLPSLIHS
jgi:hypothetical protein